MSSQSSHPWQPWQLTAYILGELEADESQRLANTIAGDPALAREMAELAATLQEVQSVYRHEKQADHKSCAIDAATISALLVAESQRTASAASVTSAEPTRLRTKLSRTRRRNVWLSLAAVLLVGISIGVLWRSGIEPEATKFMAGRDFGDVDDRAQVQAATVESLEEATEQREPESKDSLLLALDSSESLNDVASGAPSGETPPLLQYGMPSEAETQLSASGMGAANLGSEASMMGGMGGYGGAAAPNGRYPLTDDARSSGMDGYGMGGYGMSPTASNSGYGSESGMHYEAGGAQSTMQSAGAGQAVKTGRMKENKGAQDDSEREQLSTVADLAKQRGRGFGAGAAARRDTGGHRIGMGYGISRYYAEGDRFAALPENGFAQVQTAPLSTFSIDVDTASFAKARQYLLEHGRMPPPEAVRIEEFINYFDYDYEGPQGDAPFASALAVAECPWQPGHKLVRIALQAKKIDMAKRPKANLVFLLDVSGSMDEPNKLPLVQETMRLLTYQLSENDRVAMVVYAGAAGCVLESTRGDKQDEILSAIDRLSAGGSTNGGEGIQLAYSLARDHFIPGGINRVILCTDGDFNVGVTSTAALVDMVAENAKSNIFLTVLGYGMGNTNDAMMEQISDRGNGIYGFVDSRSEAKRQMVRQLAGNLMTVAKDVKIQVEFNPAKVDSYRLIGYENRMLATEDFNNDKKDAGEIGAGHRVTALYEIIPAGASGDETPAVEPLKYQPAAKLVPSSDSDELLTVKLRYKQPEGNKSSLLTFPLEDSDLAYTDADRDFRWAAAVAEFGMLLRGSQYKGTSSWDSVSRRARMAAGSEPERARSECLKMIGIAAANSPSPPYSTPGVGSRSDRE